MLRRARLRLSGYYEIDKDIPAALPRAWATSKTVSLLQVSVLVPCIIYSLPDVT